MMEQEILKNLLKPNYKIRAELKNFNEQKERMAFYVNDSLVYDLCKSIARLANMVDIDFASWGLETKFDFVYHHFLFSFNPEVVREGVITFHENCDHYKL